MTTVLDNAFRRVGINAACSWFPVEVPLSTELGAGAKPSSQWMVEFVCDGIAPEAAGSLPSIPHCLREWAFLDGFHAKGMAIWIGWGSKEHGWDHVSASSIADVRECVNLKVQPAAVDVTYVIVLEQAALQHSVHEVAVLAALVWNN